MMQTTFILNGDTFPEDYDNEDDYDTFDDHDEDPVKDSDDVKTKLFNLNYFGHVKKNPI